MPGGDLLPNQKKLLERSKNRYNLSKRMAEAEFEKSLIEPTLEARGPRTSGIPDSVIRANDMTDLVPPLIINKSQRNLLKFLFGTKDVDSIIDARVDIYNGQVNDQCPNYNDPQAIEPFVNPATGKVECRRPAPVRKIKKAIVDSDGNAVTCEEYAKNGPNPFAIEQYVTAEGEQVCRRPVVRGHQWCDETKPKIDPKTGMIDPQAGVHMTLDDGTGICVPPEELDISRGTSFASIPDHLVRAPAPSMIYQSEYYNMFTKERMNNEILSTLSSLMNKSKNKKDLVDSLKKKIDFKGSIYEKFATQISRDSDPYAVLKAHRDLYHYANKLYPGLLVNKNTPKEDVLKFVGLSGLLDKSNVKK